MNKPRVFYEVDPKNRLVLKSPPRKSSVKRFRQVVKGRFGTDKKNRLYYEVQKSSAKNVPQKIKFSGDYSLDKRHNLVYSLIGADSLRMRARLIDANGSELVFLMKPGYIMKLHGTWRTDKDNRLIFGVKKNGKRRGDLTFFNAWRIDRHNEIVYSYGRKSMVTLKGSWKIKESHRIRYALDRGIGSGFDFQSSLGRIVTTKNKPYVKFDVTIGISKKKKIKRTIIFMCGARLNKDKMIILESAPGKRHARMKLTKDILDKTGLAFIEAALGRREKYLGAGLAFRW